MSKLIINQLNEQLDIKTKECIRLEQMLRKVQEKNEELIDELDMYKTMELGEYNGITVTEMERRKFEEITDLVNLLYKTNKSMKKLVDIKKS
jgi:hypothetical protein